ncbi:MAG: Protease complex subunit PrcB family protein [Candidatus Poribacteria bacterium]|nr:Protease complex subunit PrcB family protein [Candidatus Poribacteria bacterium]
MVVIFPFVLLLLQGCIKDVVGPIMNDVLAILSTDKKIYKVGEEIEMTIVLHNRTDEPVNLTFNSGKNYDFIVKKLPENKEVWRWSEGKFFTEALMSMMLDPGERKTFVFKWNQKDNDSKKIESGTYKVEALIASNPEIFANSVKIKIEDVKLDSEFETITKGTQSGYNKRDSLVIKDQAEWEKIWNLHTSNLDQIPRVPKVDFNTDMVIAIFRGEFRTSGYLTEITQINESNDKIEVTVTETDEVKGMVLDVLTYPYHIIKVKKSDLPVNFIYNKVER